MRPPIRMRRFFLRQLLIGAILATSAFLTPTIAFAFCCKCIGSDPTKNICLKATEGACSTIIQGSSNAAVKSFTCDAVTLTDEQCQPIYDGGSALCSAAAVDVDAYVVPGSGATNTTSDVIYPPVLNVPIPGLTFQNVVIVDGGVATIPFLAQYIAAAYRYLLGIVVLAAATAIVYGGFRYVLGSTIESITTGKQVIQDAIIGLVLMFGAHIVLITLNPALVDLKGLKIATVAQKAFDSAEAERERVAESATVPLVSSQGVEVPVIIENAPGSPPIPPEVPAAPGSVPVVPGAQKPGTVVKDANGVYVAQGNCPSDMVAIRKTDEYAAKTRKTVPSFCMDIYEAPNQAGVKPFQLVSQFEADWYCSARGKRLCSDSEWTRACLGPKGENTYMYGPTMINGTYERIPGQYAARKTANPPAPCNYDSNPGAPTPFSIIDVQSSANSTAIIGVAGLLTKEENSFLRDGGSALLNSTNAAQSKNAKTVRDLMEKARTATGLAPSGSRPGCYTPEGVADLSGNAQEIMLTDAGAQKTLEQRVANTSARIGADYTWGNFFYFPIAHIANPNADPTCNQRWGGSFHGVLEFVPENSFRCCMPLNENP